MPKRIEIPVEEYTTVNPLVATPETSLNNLSTMMDENSIRHIPIVVEGKAVGIVSDRDLRVALSLVRGENVTADQLMVSNPLTINCKASLAEAALYMSKNKVGSLIVEDQGEFMGIFTSTDALNALVEIVRGEL